VFHEAPIGRFRLILIGISDQEKVGLGLLPLIRGQDRLRARIQLEDVFVGEVEMGVEDNGVMEVAQAPLFQAPREAGGRESGQ
jgi:hypothetical protein